jgi:ParB family chromosome partitioning protein
MSEGRRGLGRGLSALLEEEGPPTLSTSEPQGVGASEAPVELLRRNPDQPRRTFDEAELEELADSIRARGVLQPILVRPAPGVPGEFQIVAGERRWRAAQRAGLHTVPVLIRPLDDVEVAEISIVENIQRADLNPLEEARGYKTLLDRFGRTQDAIAVAVGKSRSHIANSLRLLNLPPAVCDHVEAGRLAAGHARAIAAAPNPAALAEIIVSRDLTVRQAEALARDAAPSEGVARPRRSRGAPPDPDTLSLEHDLSEALGLAVTILDRNGSGEVRVRYTSLDQLDGLCRKLSGG